MKLEPMGFTNRVGQANRESQFETARPREYRRSRQGQHPEQEDLAGRADSRMSIVNELNFILGSLQGAERETR